MANQPLNRYMNVILSKPSKHNTQMIIKPKVEINESSVHGKTSHSQNYSRLQQKRTHAQTDKQ